MSAVQRAYRQAMPWAERLPTVKRNNDEEQLQRDVLAYLHLALPTDAIVFAIPNGGLRSKKVAQRLSGQGVKAGIPDLDVIWRGRAFFIELKTASGRQSVQQRHMMNVLHYCGANVMLCRSLAEVEAQLREATIPLRATVSS